MTIEQNIRNKMLEVLDDQSVGVEIREKAVQAILGGKGSQAWIDYMQMFAEDDDQLARLVPPDGGAFDNAEMNLARAYLVGNGPCGALTTGYYLIQGVGTKLDEDA